MPRIRAGSSGLKPRTAKTGRSAMRRAGLATLASPIAKNFTEDQLAAIAERMQARPGDLLLFSADTFEVTCKALHTLRKRFGEELRLYDPQTMHFSWIVEFPMFAWDEEEKTWAAVQ